jgi:hypothetical protein
MVFDTKVSNKKSTHIFKYKTYKRCKICPIEINVKNVLKDILIFYSKIEFFK